MVIIPTEKLIIVAKGKFPCSDVFRCTTISCLGVIKINHLSAKTLFLHKNLSSPLISRIVGNFVYPIDPLRSNGFFETRYIAGTEFARRFIKVLPKTATTYEVVWLRENFRDHLVVVGILAKLIQLGSRSIG